MKSKNIRIFCALLFLGAMVLAACLTGQQEIIFPEAAALAVGAWIAPKQPWRVNRPALIAVMTLSAVGGVLLVRYFPDVLALKTAAGLVYTGLLLTLSGVTLISLISACILPIFLGTKSWIYPLTVFVLAVILALGQFVLEKTGLREKAAVSPTPALSVRARHWAKTVLALELLCLPATLLHLPYLAAPPLLVTFAELFFPHSPLRQKPLRVWISLSAAGLIGTLCRFAALRWELPLTLCALAAFSLTLLVFRLLGFPLPPAAAAAILPMILPAQTLWRYPPLLCIGAAVLVAVPCLFYARRNVAVSPAD